MSPLSCQERPAPRYGARCAVDVPLRLHSPPKPINTCSLDKKKHHIASESTIRKIENSKSRPRETDYHATRHDAQLMCRYVSTHYEGPSTPSLPGKSSRRQRMGEKPVPRY